MRRALAAAVLGLPLTLAACFVVLDFDGYDTTRARADGGGILGDGAAGVARGFRFTVEPTALAVRQGATGTLTVRVERDPDFTAAITVGLAAPPANVSVATKTIAPDATETTLDVVVGDAAPGTYELAIVASGGENNDATLGVSLEVERGAGELDPTFGDGGIIVGDLPFPNAIAFLAVLPDGKILAACSTQNSSTMVRRWEPSGAPDPTFNAGSGEAAQYGPGIRIVREGPPAAFGATSTGGCLLVAAEPDDDRAYGVRLLADGKDDPAFGPSAGTVELDNPAPQGTSQFTYRYFAGAVRGDGFVVSWGDPGDFAYSRGPSIGLELVSDAAQVTRGPINNVGSFDDVSSTHVAATPSGPIYVVFAQTTDTAEDLYISPKQLAARKLGPNGARDSSFGDAGLSDNLIPVTDGGYAAMAQAVVDPAGRLVVAGEAADGPPTARPNASLRMSISRLTEQGAPDPTFGNGGHVRLDALPISWASAVAPLPAGGLVVAGTRVDPGKQPAVAVVRLAEDGSIDPSFATRVEGAAGVVARLERPTEARAVAIQPDGKIVVGGLARFPRDGGGEITQLVLMRFLP